MNSSPELPWHRLWIQQACCTNHPTMLRLYFSSTAQFSTFFGPVRTLNGHMTSSTLPSCSGLRGASRPNELWVEIDASLNFYQPIVLIDIGDIIQGAKLYVRSLFGSDSSGCPYKISIEQPSGPYSITICNRLLFLKDIEESFDVLIAYSRLMEWPVKRPPPGLHWRQN